MTTYQCVAGDGTVICFRASPSKSNEIEFYSARSGGDTWTSSLDDRQWTHSRKSILENDPNRLVPEIVHAAVYLLRFKVHGVRVEDVKEASRAWGHHFPRMWRARYLTRNPLLSHYPVDPIAAYGDSYTQSVVATASLFEELTATFRYLEPAATNQGAYGHRFRELVILACTEVEASWRGVLLANTPASRHRDRLSTRDYVQLRDPLRLTEWAVELKDYPSMPELTPFLAWDSAKPTESLAWYDAYNMIKHDREGEFSRATIGAAIEAMAALFIMQCVQWGPEVYSPLFGDRATPFAVTKVPRWDAGEFYAPDPANPDDWTPDLYFP